jgi:anti-sigma factor RsiW
MNSDRTHLSEHERNALADGSLADDARPHVEAHLAECAVCASDVARIATLMKHVREAPAPTASLDELWPSIRSRIEHSKVVPLAPETASRRAPTRRRAWWIGSIGVAAALVISVFMLRGRPHVVGDPIVATADTTTSLVAVVDSVHAYEREAQILLDKLELQRAMLRPDVAEALDHDLHVVDVAIAELKDAVAHDPANPALRQLLATSYRQKVDLLKRVGNAS